MELSVIVPVYNAEKTLRQTLDSLLAQTDLAFPWEVVAVDDGSEDSGLSILREYEKKAEEKGILFRVFSYPNGGVGKCRNRGLELAQGDSILYLDADDRLHPGALCYALNKKKEHGAKIFVFDSEILEEDGTRTPFPMATCREGEMSVESYMLSHPCPWNKIIDRDLFTQNDLFFEEGILYEDLALIPALGIRAEGKIYYDKRILHSYYQSGGSIMRSGWSEKRLDLLRALDALKKNAVQRPEEVEYLAFLHLYRGFVWLCLQEGKTKESKKARAWMKNNFPHWQKNPLIGKHAAKKEFLTSLLFHHNLFWLVRLWKGGRG